MKMRKGKRIIMRWKGNRESRQWKKKEKKEKRAFMHSCRMCDQISYLLHQLHGWASGMCHDLRTAALSFQWAHIDVHFHVWRGVCIFDHDRREVRAATVLLWVVDEGATSAPLAERYRWRRGDGPAWHSCMFLYSSACGFCPGRW